MSREAPNEPEGSAWLTPHWVSGLALVMVVAVVKLAFDTNRANARMPLYLLLGTAFPLGVLVLSTGRGASALRTAARVFAAAGAGVSTLLLVRYCSIWALALAVVQWIATLVLTRSNPQFGGIREWSTALYAAIVGWTVTIQLLRGQDGIFNDFSFVDSSAFIGWTAGPRSSIPVLCASFVLVVSWSCLGGCRPAATAAWYRVIRLAPDGAALLTFSALSFRSDQWSGPHFGEAHWHWSFFVGPAQDVRDGGWLLWDVPSWYGFGNILLVAVLPTSSTWASMYLVNALTLLLSAALLYAVLRALRPDWLGWLFSMSVTVACVFLLPGRANDVTGPQIWPSAAAFRFVWVYVLLAILWWGQHRSLRQAGTSRVRFVGSVAWVGGVLWSFESAVFVSTIWLPALTLLAWRRGDGGGKRAATVTAHLVTPLSLLALAGAGIGTFYWVAAGHLPDPSGYYEVAWAFRAFRDRFYIGSTGLWFLLLVFCAASTLVATLLSAFSTWTRASSVGAWAALWSTSSYVVLKGDPNTLLGSAPLFMTCLGLLLHHACGHLPRPRAATMPHVIFASVSIALLALAYGNLPKLGQTAARLQIGYATLASHLTVLNEEERAILQATALGPRDGLVVLDAPGILDSAGLPAPTLWLPMRSWERMVLHGFVVLPPEKMRRYVSRAAVRAQAGGYVLVKKSTRASGGWAWFFEQIRQSHREEVAGETPEFLLLRYHSRDSAAARTLRRQRRAARPPRATGRGC